MALQYSVRVRNARLDAVESTIGTSAIMKIRTGAKPANCAAADSGTVLATLALPSDWMNAASSGSKNKAGVWSDLSADSSGLAGHFRIYDSGGATCDIQGSVSAIGAGGDMEIDNPDLVATQLFTITAFNIIAGNA